MSTKYKANHYNSHLSPWKVIICYWYVASTIYIHQ